MEGIAAVGTDNAFSTYGTASASISPNVLAAPTGLTATAVSANQINLSWTPPSVTVSGYDVYRGTTPGGENHSTPIWVTAAAYSDTGLTAGTTYYYTVEAVNASGGHAASNEANATTGPTAAPRPPRRA